MSMLAYQENSEHVSLRTACNIGLGVLFMMQKQEKNKRNTILSLSGMDGSEDASTLKSENFIKE